MQQNKIRNFAIIAHIDHGKSTLADRLLELTGTVESRQMKEQYLDRMDLERERGITIKLQPVRMMYEISGSEYILNLIDTPGHVDFSYEVSRSLAATEGAILLVDATQGIQAQTLANLFQAQKQNLTIIPVINKIDLPNADVDKTKAELSNLLKINPEEIIPVSAKTGENVDKVLEAIVSRIPAPKGDSQKPFRALIFDSNYDLYRGVVAYVRIVDGNVNQKEKIKFISSGKIDEALETGFFSPDYKQKNSLETGEIGYIVTGLKEVSECGVGDTISLDQSLEKIEPLPGYKIPTPMVFAGIYTIDGEVNKLREALYKLKLNDSSLYFEPENSKAFGFGFRTGFLGTLHLEIIKERLEREYNLNLIITTPQVAYKEKQVGSKIEYEEPWSNVEIITPQTYIGPIMDLFNHIRGIYQSTEYLGDRVILKYSAPLASIIVNFYDKLKSISSGYASMSYEVTNYQSGDLVKMDILIAGEKIDVLSQIVHTSQIKEKPQNIVRRLKELIPRQWFEISIQAAIGGKIMARENIPALKKDVTGYLYGGDITRKRKLWEKQAKGKKKMKKLGRVDIPTNVFIELLKN
jgi:GTP-binding protein LepA